MTTHTGDRVLSPTVRRRRLVTALRDLRVKTGLSREEVADRMEWSVSKVYRLEHGRSAASWRDIRDLCDLYGVPSPEKDALVQLARDARQRGWWTDYQDVFTGSYIGFETEAATIRSYEAELVPGLLQTEDYARAAIRTLRPTAPEEEVERRAAARVLRKTLLDQEQPPDFSWVMNEAVLRRCQGAGSDVATDQLRSLIATSGLPHVSIRVLPFAAGLHAGMEGAFVIIGFREAADPDVAYAEGLMGDIYVESIEGVGRYSLAWEQISTSALSPDKSRDLIEAVLRELQ